MIINLLKKKITPPTDIIRGLRLDGYVNRYGNALGIHDDIYLRLLRMEDLNSNVIVIGSLELVGINRVWQDSAERVNKNVILTATHTHSAPLICNELLISWYGTCNENEVRYLKYVNESIIDALNAINNEKSFKVNEAVLQEIDISSVCRNRNSLTSDKRINAYIIKGFYMGKEIPLLFHVPCHSTVLNELNLYITGDLIGYVTAKLEEMTNSIIIPLIGAAGDVSTRYTRLKQDFDELSRLGGVLVSSIGKAKSIAKITLKSIKYRERYINVLTRKNKIKELITEIEESKHHIANNAIRPYEINAIKKIISALPDKINVKLGILIFGDNVILIFMPFEPIYDVQELLKENIGDRYGKFILLIGYSYDYLGYLSNKDLISYESLSTFVNFDDIYNSLVRFIEETLGN